MSSSQHEPPFVIQCDYEAAVMLLRHLYPEDFKPASDDPHRDGTLVAFDVKPDGSLTNQRDFGKLRGGQGGDGSAVDAQGRVYVATGASVDVFAPSGEFLGSIAGPRGLHGTAFGGRDKKTLYAIVFYGTWGTRSARNRIIAIPTIAEGYGGRAK